METNSTLTFIVIVLVIINVIHIIGYPIYVGFTKIASHFTNHHTFRARAKHKFSRLSKTVDAVASGYSRYDIELNRIKFIYDPTIPEDVILGSDCTVFLQSHEADHYTNEPDDHGIVKLKSMDTDEN